MPNGTVKCFNIRRNHALIVPEDGGADTLAHVSSIGRGGCGLRNRGQRLEHDPNRDKGRRILAVMSRSVA
jgi:cold shock CspA family protein